jgi:chorismate-pyruvate lyase
MNAVMVDKAQPEATLSTVPLVKNFLTIEQLPFFSHLNPVQRIMLVSDGNLTNMLQAYFLETIGIRVVAQHIMNSSDDFEVNRTFLKRQVVLYGTQTLRPYVYAESTLAFNQLPPELARDLQYSDIPLGRLWLHHRLETFKELIDVRVSNNETAAGHFGKDDSGSLLKRSYRVVSKGRPCMVIHEYFPVVCED